MTRVDKISNAAKLAAEEKAVMASEERRRIRKKRAREKARKVGR